ncbi:MAG: hypothetical protein LBS99_07090, partial [Clostridiales bacterium]|nr:hypothetical protein [Clostridiales bacterium]
GIAETYYRFGAAGGYTAASGVSVTVSAVSENLGEWWFYARDNAGNDSAPQRVVMSIVSTFGNREQISNGYKITGWYNVTLPARVFTTTNKDEAGIYSFADYATALRFAFAKETEYRVSALSDSWVYLSASNENVAQVYTDRAALDAAVEKYAKTYISAEQRYINGKNNYYTPVNGTLSLDPAALTRQELVLPSFLSYFGLPALQCQPDYKFTRLSPGYATAPSGVSLRYVADDVHAVTEEAFGITYGVTVISALASKRQGYYLVTESDAAGNEERYIIYLDRQAPVVTVSVTFGDGGNVCITFDESYLADYAGTLYYCAVDFQTVFDNDNYYCLKITGRNLNKTFLQGETLPNLNTADFSGKYTVELYDRSLNTLQFEIVVSNEPPRMSTSALSSDTECRLAVVIPDSFNAITKLQLFKILYDGSYQEVFQDDNGTTVSFLNLTYTLRTGGKYTMRFTDLFGRDIEAAPVFFTKGLPKAVLSGVADGGITNRNVSLRYSGEDTLTAYAWADGIKTVFTDYTTTYQNNTDTYTAVITANAETSHEYVFLLFKTDDRNLFVEYGFEIDCVIAELNILDIGKNTIPYDGATNKAFYITWSETLTLNYYTSRTVGGALGAVKYNQGTVLSQNGIYYFSLRDSVGNTKDFTVLLDDYVSFEIKGAYTVIAANRFIAKNELTVTILEAVAVFNVTNADNYVIGNGGTLKFDGMYVIYAVDNYGNGITLYIELDTVPPVIVLSGVEPGGIVRGVVTVNFLGYSEAYTVDGRDKILQKITDGAVFAEHGKYRITAQDVAGNKTTVEFDIDIKVDYVFSLENGAFTTDRASLVFSEPLSEISVTLNGAPAEAGERFVDLGAYAVFARDIAGNTVSITFTVIPARAQRLELPIAAEWRLERAEMNGRTAALTADDDKLTLEENGVYVLTFGNPQTNAAFTVTVTIDHEPPTVEITQESKNGVIIGAASKDNVSFALTRDGKEVAFKKTLSDPGQYKLVVIDDIGNVNVYEFTISYRMNAFAVVLSVIGALILLATVFLIARARRKPAVK